MRKQLMTMIAAVLVSAAATAQEKQSDRRLDKKFDKQEMIQHRTKEDVKRYGLNEKQAAALLALNTKYADKMVSPRRPRHHGKKGDKNPDATTGATPQQPPKDGKQPPKDGKKRPDLTPEQKAKFEAEHKEREAARKAYEGELQKIMTPEQFKCWQADQEKHRHHHGPGHDPRPKQ